HREALAVGGAVLVGNGDGDGVAAIISVGVIVAECAQAGHVVAGVVGAIAPVDLDRPRAVGTRVDERAQVEGGLGAFVRALVAGRGHARCDIHDSHKLGVAGVAAVLIGSAGGDGVAVGSVGVGMAGRGRVAADGLAVAIAPVDRPAADGVGAR